MVAAELPFSLGVLSWAVLGVESGISIAGAASAVLSFDRDSRANTNNLWMGIRGS